MEINNILDITPLDYAVSNCLLSTLFVLTKNIRGNYDFMLPGSWFFKYNKKNKTDFSGQQIESFDESEIKHILTNLYNIDYTWHQKRSFDITYNGILGQLAQNRPVGLTIDAGWCHWSSIYQKESAYHFILIIGNDPCNNFYCIDNISSKIEMITIDDLEKGFDKYIFFNYDEALPAKSCSKATIHTIFNSLFMNNRVQMFEDIRRFAEEVRVADLKEEISYYNALQAVPIFRQIRFIENGRYNISLFLKILDKMSGTGQYATCAERIYQSGIVWNSIKTLLIKISCIEDFSKQAGQRIYEKLQYIATDEEIFFNQMYAMVKEWP